VEDSKVVAWLKASDEGSLNSISLRDFHLITLMDQIQGFVAEQWGRGGGIIFSPYEFNHSNVNINT